MNQQTDKAILAGVDPDPGVVHRCEAVACDV